MRDIPTHLITHKKSFYTTTGPMLRKFSIDEIPQLINIIIGDMVFIGPRPALYNQDDLIKLRTKVGVHKLAPGITGWAQVNGRDELSITDKVRMDQYYLINKSIWLDIKILFYTYFKVIQSEGAHLKDYDDFANPYLEFLSCLYLACHGSGQTDLADAEVALKRLQGMVEVSMPAWDQLAIWLNAMTENKSPIQRTMIVFETGRAASLEQIRIDIPIIMGDVSYLGAAFPQLVFHDRFYSGLQVQAGGESHGTSLVCDIDSLVAYEYKKNFPIMLARTLASSVAKGVTAYMANRAASDQDAVFGLLMKVGNAIAQAAVNIADTRSWNTLPKQVHFCQIDTPPGGALTLSTTDDRFVSDLILDEKKSHMILVRSIGMNAPLTIDAFEL